MVLSKTSDLLKRRCYQKYIRDASLVSVLSRPPYWNGQIRSVTTLEQS